MPSSISNQTIPQSTATIGERAATCCAPRYRASLYAPHTVATILYWHSSLVLLHLCRLRPGTKASNRMIRIKAYLPLRAVVR